VRDESTSHSATQKAPYLSASYNWRVIPIPDDGGFKIVVDTREQKPVFDLSLPYVIRTKVDNGDYTLLGMESLVAIELKRMSDFMGYIGKERKQHTEPKLVRLKPYVFKALCVLESEASVLSPAQRYSRLSPEHVRGFLTALHVKYGVVTYFNPDVVSMRRWMLDRLIYAYNYLRSTETMNER